MKPALQKTPISREHAFDVHYLKAPYFDPTWHFHSEYQLFIVLKGTGTRFVGDHVSPFKPGDLVFTGPNLPHVWRSDPEFFEGTDTFATEGIVVYFDQSFPGMDLMKKNEMFRIRQLLEKSKRGIEFFGTTAVNAKLHMEKLGGLLDCDRVLSLLQLLNMLSLSAEFNYLSSAAYSNSQKASDVERLNNVHKYVMNNFREKITLVEVASLASMAPSSFSRYFKTHANKTFSDFLTEIRIGYACKLLIEKKVSVSEACYASGFHTLSNFNRQFKAITRYTPLAYRKIYSDPKVSL